MRRRRWLGLFECRMTRLIYRCLLSICIFDARVGGTHRDLEGLQYSAESFDLAASIFVLVLRSSNPLSGLTTRRRRS